MTQNETGSNAQPPTETEAQVFVVRLDGNIGNPATERPEGQGFQPSDVGNTFTLSGEYLSYAAQWLGDTAANAVLNWNGVAYVAGIGGGSSGYAHASLPGMGAVSGVVHDDEILLTAEPDAFVEFRFRRAV